MTDDDSQETLAPADSIDITFSPNTEYHVSIHIGDLPDGLQRFASKLGHTMADLIDEFSLPEDEQE